MGVYGGRGEGFDGCGHEREARMLVSTTGPNQPVHSSQPMHLSHPCRLAPKPGSSAMIHVDSDSRERQP